jgi:thiol-disulfide isomerase/thioredoxin
VTLGQFRGQPVLINFWATWCGPCRTEMPEIEASYQKYRAAGFVVLALDVEEPPEDVHAFVDEFKLSFVPLLDESAEVFKLYKVRALPTSYFVGTEGNLSAIHLGPMTGAQISAYVDNLLAKP